MKTGGLSEKHLRNNLAGLASRSPDLFERLCEGVESHHIQLHDALSGDVTASLTREYPVFLHSPSDPVREAEETVQTAIPPGSQAILCLGVGLGYYLEALLTRANPSRPVLAYERDPWLLRLALSRFDFSRDILAGRVRFLLGTDLTTVPATGGAPPFIWPHPVLGTLYKEEQAYLRTSPTPQSRRAMVASGGLFVHDLVEALQDRGVNVLTWNPKAVSKKETLHQIKTYEPHLLFTINFCQGLPEIAESLGIPLLVWEIDPTIESLPPGRYPFARTHIFTYRKSRVSHFREAGFEHVEYLPLATNPKRRFPVALSAKEREQYGARISFVGSSMVDQSAALHALYGQLAGRLLSNSSTEVSPGSYRNPPLPPFAKEGIEGLWERGLACQRQTPDRYLLDDFLAGEGLGRPGATHVQDANGRMVDLALCMGEAAASERRVRILSNLDHDGLKVWGDADWRRVLPPSVHYCGTAGHSRALTLIYNASQINLDINRIYQQDIVTMRVFDIMACKAFVLADASDALGEFFALNHEVVAYPTVSSIRPLAEHFLRNESERTQLAEAGYNRVIKDHTIARRLEQMLQHL